MCSTAWNRHDSWLLCMPSGVPADIRKYLDEGSAATYNFAMRRSHARHAEWKQGGGLEAQSEMFEYVLPDTVHSGHVLDCA